MLGLLIRNADYTLFDWKIMTSEAGNIAQSKRPFLDEFLVRVCRPCLLRSLNEASVYPDYDIVIWSQVRPLHSRELSNTHQDELAMVGA